MGAVRKSKAVYLGHCFEPFEDASGKVELRKLHVYRARDGERRFTLTEADARRSCE